VSTWNVFGFPGLQFGGSDGSWVYLDDYEYLNLDHPEDDDDIIRVYTDLRDDSRWAFVPPNLSHARRQTGQTQQGLSAFIDTNTNQKLKDAIDYLKTFKPSEECQKEVIDKLKDKLGLTLEDFQKYLEKGFQAFDITQSTASVVGTLFTEAQAKGYGYTSATTISEAYRDVPTGKKTPDGRDIVNRTNAATSSTADRFTFYLRPDALGDGNRNRAFVFHEALHGFLTNGRTDPDLQRAFGISETESVNISDYIQKYCFK
jgi:hypothetical protein